MHFDVLLKMGTESITYRGREFNASSSTMEIWLRLLAMNLHPYGDKGLVKVQQSWLNASDNLECFPVTLDGLEDCHPQILQAAESLLGKLDMCEEGVAGEFINLLGFTNFSASENVNIEMKQVIRAGTDFRNLLTGDTSTSSEINKGENKALDTKT